MRIAFNVLKDEITRRPILSFFDITKQVLIQTDASKDGLGCVLLQDGLPVSFASRSLTVTEQKYAQIEKEMLAVVFAMDKFSQFVYGKKFIVHSDHKPLVTIVKKNISLLSARLQRMVLKTLKYDYDVV